VAIVDGAFLLVLDHVREIAPERTVQVYFHLDSPAVTWDADRRVATTHHPATPGSPGPVGRPDVNVAILATPNVRGSLLEGRVSDFLDVARPSTRLLLEDATSPVPSASSDRSALGGATDTSRLYAAVIVPYRATDPASTPVVSNLSIAQDADRTVCSFTLADHLYRFAWTPTTLTRFP
jgi:hypothetical protein